MELTKGKLLLILTLILFSVFIVVGLFLLWKNSQVTKQALIYQNIPNLKVTYDVNKVPDQFYQNAIRNSKNISINIAQYSTGTLKFPISDKTQYGNYEYNITFTNDGIIIDFATDSSLSSHTDFVGALITRLILASSQQKFDKQLTNGSLLNKEITDDHIIYLNKILADDKVNKISIVSLR